MKLLAASLLLATALTACSPAANDRAAVSAQEVVVAPVLTTPDAADKHSYARPHEARVSHIEHGAVATIELLARYLDAIGGRLEITAAFDGGTERVVLDWPAA